MVRLGIIITLTSAITITSIIFITITSTSIISIGISISIIIHSIINCRGLDVEGVQMVINFDMPKTIEAPTTKSNSNDINNSNSNDS